MLPKDKRLRKERDFKRVYQRGSFFSARFFNANFAPNHLNSSRLAFVVSKKTAKKAVDRNLAKRKLRESFRSLYEALPKGYDVVVNIKKEALGADFDLLKQDIKRLAERMGRK